jgi:hypothetical protein
MSKWTGEALREELLRLTILASSRGRGGTLSREEAERVVAALLADDQAAEWLAVRVGEADLRALVSIIRVRLAAEEVSR